MAHPHAPGGMVFVDPRGHVMMAPPQAHPHPAPPHPAAAFYPAAHPYGMMMFAGQHAMMPQQMVMPQAAHPTHLSANHVQPSAPATGPTSSARPPPPAAQYLEQHPPAQPCTSTPAAAPSVSTSEVTSSKPEPPSAAAMAAAAAAVAGGLTSTASTASEAKGESQSEKKARIEHEKQDLIREFKKKTREAALVRFRQKRSERRFGKLIRYDCRKKLADARPRVKGRFVRIKEDEMVEDDSESAQVVPGYIER